MATKRPAEAYLEVWEKASEQAIGLCIDVVPEDQVNLVNALYECRKTFGGYEGMIIVQPEPKGQVWIMWEGTELPE